MIVDRLENAARYFGAHPLLEAGFGVLGLADLASLAPGKHDVDGDRIYLVIGHDPGRAHEGARLEAHRKYLDIQLTLDGAEEIGWRPLAACREVAEDYDSGRDIAFFADRPAVWLPIPPQSFAVFFPEDAHAPLGGSGPLRKAVVKIAVDAR